ncbi:cache domain-containing protein [Marinomonas posidonica]|uniref:Cache type 2 domain protein n=1 Tax=Marinomonas posidonica (strain CECT 7376 / NCIMB 14433 / IVIA-Po-181) TaxID=491952 RepID=F6CZ24_MARPP|nr:cache domain-containing protein [Marinomonas posidonica]AEF53480.1 Cache type 2 domain protein [Marinomonas posidonica IVIA-Po-181]
MKLSSKFTLIVFVVFLVIAGLSYLSVYTLKESLIDARKHEIQSILKFTVNQANYYIEQEKNQILTREEAEEKVEALLSTMRFDNYYIWANDSNGIARVHVKQSVVGAFQTSYPKYVNDLDEHPFMFVVGESRKATSNALYVKVNGMTLLPDWRWMIGIGVYLDELDETLRQYTHLVIAIAVASFLLLLGVLLWVYRNTISVLGDDPNRAYDLMRRVEREGVHYLIEERFHKGSLLYLIRDSFEHFYHAFESMQQHAYMVADKTEEVTLATQQAEKLMQQLLVQGRQLSEALSHNSEQDIAVIQASYFALLQDLEEVLVQLNCAVEQSSNIKQGANKIIDDLGNLDF